MEKANRNLEVQKSRYIQVVPAQLREIAARMEFEAENADRSKDKIFFRLTDDITLYYDPETMNLVTKEGQ